MVKSYNVWCCDEKCLGVRSFLQWNLLYIYVYCLSVAIYVYCVSVSVVLLVLSKFYCLRMS